MAKAKKTATPQKPIEQYEHNDKQRLNNPPVGLVDAHTDNGGQKKKKYDYDPHLDPQLQWAGKTEHTSFEVPAVSLHVHERIDPRRIIETVKKVEGEKWVVDSNNKQLLNYGDFKKLSGINSLAEINGLSGNDLYNDTDISERRNLRTDKPNAEVGNLNTLEHRGRAIEELYRRVLAFLGNT